MRTIALIVALMLAATASAQFKSQVEAESRVADGMAQAGESPTLFLGWFNPENFHMHHTFGLSYSTFGGQGMSLGSYTNSMSYDFSSVLNARADVSMLYSPQGGFSTGSKGKNDLSSIFLSRAELNYRPWENFRVQLQFRQMPYSSYYYGSPSLWYGDGF